jgi:hypothetical protein
MALPGKEKICPKKLWTLLHEGNLSVGITKTYPQNDGTSSTFLSPTKLLSIILIIYARYCVSSMWIRYHPNLYYLCLVP